jgi:NarL family two-component system response regulator LiaR
MINIAILEDIAEINNSLKELINNQDDMNCNYTYQNAEDAMKFLPQHEVDILIADIGLPKINGIEVINYLSVRCPDMQFCIFTVYEDDDKIFHSIQSGARGYILKGSSKEKILNSIRELYEGGSPMSPSIARRIMDIFQKAFIAPSTRAYSLTARENELLNLLSMGLLYKEIGEKMGITTGTVKQHIHKIYEKLQVNNKTEAINKYRKQ